MIPLEKPIWLTQDSWTTCSMNPCEAWELKPFSLAGKATAGRLGTPPVHLPVSCIPAHSVVRDIFQALTWNSSVSPHSSSVTKSENNRLSWHAALLSWYKVHILLVETKALSFLRPFLAQLQGSNSTTDETREFKLHKEIQSLHTLYFPRNYPKFSFPQVGERTMTRDCSAACLESFKSPSICNSILERIPAMERSTLH